jgi:hypothetical protein
MKEGDMFTVCFVKEEEGLGHKDKIFWPRIGVAFVGKEGRINVILDSIPVSSLWDGRLFLFPPKTSDEETKTKKKRASRPQKDLDF